MISDSLAKQITGNVFHRPLSRISTSLWTSPGFKDKVKVALGILLAIFCLEVHGQTTRYVKPGGSGNGSSWVQAYGDLQEAINASSANDLIFVASGTYRPNRRADDVFTITPDDPDNAFVLKADVKIYGGFIGWETSLSERVLNPAHRSTLDGFYHAYHVVISAGDVGDARLDGFTITGGNSKFASEFLDINGYPVNRLQGAGMVNHTSSPTIANCLFQDNRSPTIGGMHNINASPYILNCEFVINWHTVMLNAGQPEAPASPTIVNCVFSYGYPGSGTAIAIRNQDSNSQVINCTFVRSDGIALSNKDSNPRICNNIFYHNYSQIENVNSTPKLANNLIRDSGGSGDGWNSALGIDEGGNIDADPLFADLSSNNYTLQPGSPAINAGSNGWIPAGVFTDLNGAPRIQFDLVDMGAYEANSLAGADAEHIASENTETSGWQTANGQTYYATDSNTLIAGLAGDGTETAVSGNVAVKVWVQTDQPGNYVKRHYEIVPEENPSTSTGIVTLYFTQEEFDEFNSAVNTISGLPQHPDDDEGKANLLIEKRGGASTDDSGAPASYTGDVTTITPDQVAWNADGERWEITFTVTGFSGFFVKTQFNPLPVKLVAFTGQYREGAAQLQWQTAHETAFSRFEVEKSKDGSAFSPAGNVPAKGTGSRYTYPAIQPEAIAYYRLKMVDLDGSYTYSSLVSVRRSDVLAGISVFPNPLVERLFVEIPSGSEVTILDLNGRIWHKAPYNASKGIDMGNKPAGLYLVRIAGEQRVFRVMVR